MKKIVLVLLTVILVCTLAAPTFAAKTAFENVVLNNNPDEFAYLPNEEGRIRGNNVIQYMEAYGCGYGTQGDMVQFKNLDFGTNGADAMTLSFSYGGESTTTVAVHLDDKKSAPIATFSITNTGGWDKTKASEFTTAVKVPGGTHDIFVEFTNEESGSFSYIRFNEAAAPVATATAATGAAATATAPATADMGVIASIGAIMTSVAGFVALNKKR